MATTQTAAARFDQPFEQDAEGKFVCPDCGTTYGRERAVRRHMTEKHGWPVSERTQLNRERRKTEPVIEEDEDSVSFQIRAELRELALPLQEKLKTIDRRLIEINREAADLREAKKQIEKTLQSLLPQAAPVHGATANGKAAYGRKALAIEEFVTKRLPPSLQEGFTATALTEAMKEEGKSPVFSVQVAGRVIKEMHDRGVVRLDRVSKGGGNSYVLVSRNGQE